MLKIIDDVELKELEEWKKEKGCSIQEVFELFIPKSKVKEKIEELKLSLKDDCLALHEFQRLAKIDVLEDLLREE